jgi:hypothetical protein
VYEQNSSTTYCTRTSTTVLSTNSTRTLRCGRSKFIAVFKMVEIDVDHVTQKNFFNEKKNFRFLYFKFKFFIVLL